MSIERVVSGGQTGVDRAALDAARAVRIPIGGWCPQGRLAEDGAISGIYPLRETPSATYPERTEWNVRDSDATLIVCDGEPTGGTALTVDLAERYGRPWLCVSPEKGMERATEWLHRHEVRRLNVAGPRESTCQGIGARSEAFFRELLVGFQAEMTPLLADRMSRFAAVDIYPVTCEALSAGRSDVEVLEAIIAGGARIIQLRDKEATRQALFAKAERFRALTADAGVLLIINDHVDIALAVSADGVHLGQADFPVAAALELMPDGIIGASTHCLEDALRAEAEGARYINIGPIYPTKTKGGLSEFVGPAMVQEIAPKVRIPFTVMGGIKDDKIPELVAAGARHIAVVTAITGEPDMAAALRGLRATYATHVPGHIQEALINLPAQVANSPHSNPGS